jgi:hypothetical protein
VNQIIDEKLGLSAGQKDIKPTLRLLHSVHEGSVAGAFLSSIAGKLVLFELFSLSSVAAVRVFQGQSVHKNSRALKPSCLPLLSTLVLLEGLFSSFLISLVVLLFKLLLFVGDAAVSSVDGPAALALGTATSIVEM